MPPAPPSVPPARDSGGAAGGGEGPPGGPPPGVPPPVISTGLLHEVTPPWVIISSAQKAPAGRPSVIPKAKYMTLGPFFLLQ